VRLKSQESALLLALLRADAHTLTLAEVVKKGIAGSESAAYRAFSRLRQTLKEQGGEGHLLSIGGGQYKLVGVTQSVATLQDPTPAPNAAPAPRTAQSKAGPLSDAPVQNLDACTRLALADLETVAEGDQAMGLSEVYVEREVESEIRAAHAGGPCLLVLSAPGGYGKSSLLWRLSSQASQ
jgi:hypothetical protein